MLTQKEEKIAVFPGTFDPIHWGHLDVLREAARLFDSVYWCIADNPLKKPMFHTNQRLKMMNDLATEHNVHVVSTDKFIVDACNEWSARYIVRSFRMTSDFEYEMQLAMINNKLAAGMITTVYFPAKQHNLHISSTYVRELIKAKRLADLYDCVPPILIDKGYFDVTT